MTKRRVFKDVKSMKTSPLRGTAKPRYQTAALIGCGVGLMIVVVSAFFMPPLDDGLPNKLGVPSQANETSAADEVANSGGLVADVPSRSGLVLPTEPVALQVPELQDELRTLADSLTTQYPDDVASFHFAAQAYSELKQSEKAEELWRQCLVQSPQHMGPYVGFASMLMEKGRNEEAVKVLKQAQELGGSAPEMLEKLGEAFENLGDLPNALACLTEGTKAYSEVAILWLILGRVQNQMGKSAEAEASLRKSIALGGDKEAALFVLNAALVRQRKTAEAAANRDELAKLKQARGLPTDSFQDSYDLALRRIASEIFASAGTLAETHENLKEAERLYTRAASLNPKNVEAYRGLLAICRRQQRAVDQKTLLNKLIELQPQDLIAHTNLAIVALQLGDPGLAELTLKKAIALDPQGVLAQAALVKLYLSTGNLGDARLLAAQVVERQPSSASYRLLAATYQASGFEESFVAANKRADELAEVGTNASPPK